MSDYIMCVCGVVAQCVYDWRERKRERERERERWVITHCVNEERECVGEIWCVMTQCVYEECLHNVFKLSAYTIVRAHTYAHTPTHTYTHIQTHTYTYTHTHTQTHTSARMHMYTLCVAVCCSVLQYVVVCVALRGMICSVCCSLLHQVADVCGHCQIRRGSYVSCHTYECVTLHVWII